MQTNTPHHGKNTIPLVAVVGPTASGKTRLAIDLALHFGGEIVSADSMQVYQHMSIGTAKPTSEEMRGIPHHLIDFLEPGETFSVADFVTLARQTIDDITARGKLPILAGGTGLYVSSLVDNLQFGEVEQEPFIRQKLKQQAETLGNEAMHQKLQEVDPTLADKLHPGNLGRVLRALEVYELTGRPMSWHQEQARSQPSPYQTAWLGLDWIDRNTLYERIDLRVDQMVEQGLLQEAEKLFASQYSGTAAQAIGYKELLPYFEGSWPLEQCLDEIKRQSRRYAKRQLTWFRRNENIHWLVQTPQTDYNDTLAEAIHHVEETLGFDTKE